MGGLVLEACLCGLLATYALGADAGGEGVKPLLRITPGGELIALAGPVHVAAAGDIRPGWAAVADRREPAKEGAGEALAFGPGGRLSWRAADLLRADGGAILLDFAYAAKGYADEPVLAVDDAQGNAVLRVTISAAAFKVSRPPYEFAMDLFLNEREGSWLRTALVWERLDAQRTYLRVTVNDRTYERAIIPNLPAPGDLHFTVAPEGSRLREAAIYGRPIAKQPHPHITRAPSAEPAVEALRRLARVSLEEQRALDEAGGVVVFVPEGAQTHGLLSALRTMGLLRFRVARAGELQRALARAAALILPDNDTWPADPADDAVVCAYVEGGGGLLALGAGALEARRLGLAQFEPREAPMEGRTHVEVRLAPRLWQDAPKELAAPQSLELRTRRGPLFVVPPERAEEIIATNSLTKLPYGLATVPPRGRDGRGRVALASAYPFGYYFCHPNFENFRALEANARAWIWFKALLFHAAALPLAATNEGELAEATAVPVIPATLRGRPWPLDAGGASGAASLQGILNKVSVGDGGKDGLSFGEQSSARFGKLELGASGSLSFWIRADTLNLAGAQPRNLLFLSGGGGNSLQLYYDPRDQFLILAALTPNEENWTIAAERTSWDGRAWRHIAFSWRATATGDAAVELFIDGQQAAAGGMPLPTEPWDTLIVGATAGMTGLAHSLRGLTIVPQPLNGADDLAAVRAQAAPPIPFADTAEEAAHLQQFVRGHKLAVLGEDSPGFFGLRRSFEVYGLTFDVLMEKDLREEALAKGGYSVLYAPGGGQPAFSSDPQGLRDRIRRFVADGGGFVGICAGLFEASSGKPPDKASNLFKTPYVAFGGCELVDILLAEHPVTRGAAGSFRAPEPRLRFMHMSGAPLAAKTPGADIKPIAWLALDPDLALAGSFTYGKGRGVVWCPHPEAAHWSWWKASDRTRQAMRRLFRNSIYVAAGAEPFDPAAAKRE